MASVSSWIKVFSSRQAASLLVFVALLLLSVGPGQAHGYIVRAIPEDRATLTRPPARLQYWFSEALEPGFSEINLRNQDGEVVASGGVDADNTALLALRVPSALPDGAYIVELRPAFASDGHVVAESRVFFVGDEVGGVTGSAASDAAIPLEVVWRALLTMAHALLLGTVTLYVLVLVPAWGTPKHPAGRLPPRVMRRLNRVMWAGIALALAGNVLALVQQTMVFFNVDALQVLTGGLWQVVRIGSRFGDVWNVRVLLLLVVALIHGWSIRNARNAPAGVRPLWTVQVWLLALIIGSGSVNSHAAGSLVWPWVAVSVHWLHNLGAALWTGGIAALVLVLPVALAPYEPSARRGALLAVMRRFSRWIVGVVLVVIASGMLSATHWFFTPSDLATTYGAALAYKLLLIALLLLIAGLHHVALRPGLAVRLERQLTRIVPFAPAQPIIRQFYKLIGRFGAFGASLRLEVVLVALVLSAASLLASTPIPEPEFLQADLAAPRAVQSVEGLQIGLTVTPGGPGINTYDLTLRDATGALNDAEVRVQQVQPERGVRSPWLPLETIDAGLYATTDDAIDQSGRWWSVVDVVRDDVITRAVFVWDIQNEAAILTSRAPSLLHWAALGVVLIALGYALAPTARRVLAALDLSPTNVLVAGGMTLISVIVIGASIAFVSEQQARYAATLNPPPQRVNPVPPTQASLDNGEMLYNAHCLRWQSVTDFRALRANLDELGDDVLYQTTQSGWRDVPPCEGDLTERERWHIVNYFRARFQS